MLDEDQPIFREAFVRALKTGALACEVRVRWPDGSIHWIAPLGRTYYDESGRGVRMAGVVADLTERKNAEAARQLLVRELNHRVRNLFSVIDAIIYLTAETTKTPGDMAGALRGRLLALARAHELILPAVMGDPAATGDGDLAELVAAVVSPHLQDGSERIRIEGPRLPVAARSATSLALVLHELATNAAKYGALSSPRGRVEILWRTDDERMALTWNERDGPEVVAARSAGGSAACLPAAASKGSSAGPSPTTGPGAASGSPP